MLSVDTAAQYLLDHGLITPQAILTGDLTITSAARRNRNLRVTQRAGRSYLIKQPDDPSFGGGISLRCEAAFYSFCRQDPDLTPIQALLPQLLYLDNDQAVLALELLNDVQPLWDYCNQFTAALFPNPVVHAVGHAIGSIHHLLPLARVAEDPRLAWLRREVPWILQVHKPSPDLLAAISPANYQILQIIQTQEQLSAHLDSVRALWHPLTLIHNDIKSDNILVCPPAEGGPAAAEIRLVDWELVQVGDPAWDVAGMLQDFVLFWIFSMSNLSSVDAMVASARYPLAVLHGAIRAFWHGYRTAAHLTVAAANALLARAVRFSAARLIQTAYEMAQTAQTLPAASVLLLQISANLLTDPAVRQVQLYGLFQEGGVL